MNDKARGPDAKRLSVGDASKLKRMLVEARVHKGYTQKRLAKACGFGHQSSIAKLEQDPSGITFSKLEHILHTLDIPISSFIDEYLKDTSEVDMNYLNPQALGVNMNDQVFEFEFDLETMQHLMKTGTNVVRTKVATRLCHIVHAELIKLDATIGLGKIHTFEVYVESEKQIHVEVEYVNANKEGFRLVIEFPFLYSDDPHSRSRIFYPSYELFAVGENLTEVERNHPMITVNTLTALVDNVVNNPIRLASANIVELPRKFDIIRRNGELMLCVQELTRDSAPIKELLNDQFNFMFDEFSDAIDGNFQSKFNSDDVSEYLVRLGVRTEEQVRKLTDDELKQLGAEAGLDLSALEYREKIRSELDAEPLMTRSVEGIDLPTLQFVNLDANTDAEPHTIIGELHLELEAGYSVVDRFVLQSDVKNLIQQHLAHSQSTTDLLKAINKL